jgi:hypothetical protein
MSEEIYVALEPSKRVDKRFVMTFSKNGVILKRVHFGNPHMENYTIHKDKQRKERFLKRFNKLINKFKDDPFKPMTLSHLILWNKPTLKESLKDYKKRYSFK